MLKKLIEKNRKLYKKAIIDYDEYFENHMILMEKIKKSIVRISEQDMNFIATIDMDDCVERYRRSIMIVKFNMN